MSLDNLVETWKDVREGLIAEASKIPSDKFDFKATPETRSVAELLQRGVNALGIGVLD